MADLESDIESYFEIILVEYIDLLLLELYLFRKLKSWLVSSLLFIFIQHYKEICCMCELDKLVPMQEIFCLPRFQDKFLQSNLHLQQSYCR